MWTYQLLVKSLARLAKTLLSDSVAVFLIGVAKHKCSIFLAFSECQCHQPWVRFLNHRRNLIKFSKLPQASKILYTNIITCTYRTPRANFQIEQTSSPCLMDLTARFESYIVNQLLFSPSDLPVRVLATGVRRKLYTSLPQGFHNWELYEPESVTQRTMFKCPCTCVSVRFSWMQLISLLFPSKSMTYCLYSQLLSCLWHGNPFVPWHRCVIETWFHTL